MTGVKELSWFSQPGLGVGMGYGTVSLSLLSGLNSRGISTKFDSPDPRVSLSYVQPEWYRLRSDQINIGYTPWESTMLPDSWIPNMKKMDKIWTTSTFCKEVFDKHNVSESEVEVLPHGISDLWKPEGRELRDRFVFFHCGAPTPRKGGDKVVGAFLDLFEGDESFHLIMKTNGAVTFEVGDRVIDGSHPQITVLTMYVDEPTMVSIYKRSHCLVYPTSGEGWGMIPWQGICQGLPTICTNATGCAEFAEYSVPLDYRMAKGQGVHLGDWAEPDEDDLRDKMKYVVGNYSKVQYATMQSARILHRSHSWDSIVDSLIQKIERIS